MGVIRAALATEITAALVATKFSAALEFCEFGFFVNFFVVVVVRLPFLVDLFVPLDSFTFRYQLRLRVESWDVAVEVEFGSPTRREGPLHEADQFLFRKF